MDARERDDLDTEAHAIKSGRVTDGKDPASDAEGHAMRSGRATEGDDEPAEDDAEGHGVRSGR